ncbi:thiamine phosphate synthase [Nitratifractor sp.]
METRIYALLDADLMERYGIDLNEACDFLKRHRIPVAQYRDKTGSDAEVLQALRRIRSRYGGTLIVNDHIECVSEAHGLHLGQEDLRRIDPDPARAVEALRKRVGAKILGLSTHDEGEIEAANALDLDYVGLGAYRPTRTKADARISGERLLEIARRSRHPVAIIGGVRWEDRFEPPIVYKVLGSALFERIVKDPARSRS